MNHSRSITWCTCSLLIASTLALGACRPLAMTADRMVFKGNTAAKQKEVDDLRARRDELAAQYEQAVIQLDQDIQASKEEIDALIAQGQIGPALVKIKAMDADLHDTKYNAITKRHRLTAKEGKGQKAYLHDASARALAAVEGVMASGEFQRLDSWLSERKDLPATEATLAGFAARHEELYSLWVAFLVKEVDRTRSDSPGSALVYALKAQQLATQIQDQGAAQKMASEAKSLRERLARDHAYVFTVTSTSSANAEQVARSISSNQWGAQLIKATSSKSARTDATVSLSLGSPAYKTSKTSRTDSFKYQSGTQQVPNPEIDRAQSDVESAQRDIARLEDQRSDEQKRYEDNSNMSSCEASGRVKSCQNARESAMSNIKNIEGKLRAEREDLAEAQSKLASLPKTITKPVYDQYDYDVTVHHMKASYSFEARVTSLRGHDGARRATTIEAHLTDEEHAAHSKNDGSVAADPAKPPTQNQALSSLQSKAKSTLEGVILEGFNAHREAMLQGLPEQKEARIQALAIYVLMAPESASEAAVSQLESLAQIEGIVGLMK